MKVIKTKNNMYEEIYNYILDNGEDKLKISYERNLDLYFSVESKKEDVHFEITKEDIRLYRIFDDLYNDIKESDVFKITDDELKLCDNCFQKENLIKEKNRWNSSLRNSYAHKKLFKKNFINWVSDDSIEEDYNSSNTLIIKKEEDKYVISIGIHDKYDEFSHSVRISNSGSRYNAFSLCMMRFYDNLQSYDPKYHQINIEEYLYKIKTKNLYK